ncbi:MAG: CHAT domain-containing protein [Rhodothermales bacterium]|nr:CHAT domain-containing protein [Rhodothermales bacterium]
MKLQRIILLALIFGGLALPSSAQRFDLDLRAALQAGEEPVVEQLVQANRLAVKAEADSLLHRVLVEHIAGRAEAAGTALDQARMLAGVFERLFGETSIASSVSLAGSLSREEQAEKLRADSLEARATALRASRDTREEALDLYNQALAVYERLGDAQGEAAARGGIGYLHWFLDRSRYLEMNLAALRAREAADDRQLIGNSLYDVGLAYQAVERSPMDALHYYRRSDSIRAAIGDSLAMNRMLPVIASLYRSMGDLAMARRYYERAIVANAWAGDDRRLAISERNLGVLLSEMGFHSDALGHLRRALDVYEANEDAENAAPVISWMGVVHRRLGDYEAAIESYQRAIEIANEVDNPEWLADAYNNLGVVFAFADRYDRAASYYRRALTQFESIGSARGRLDATLNIADSHFELKEYGPAEEFGDRALVLADSVGDPIRTGRALGTLGSVYARTARIAESDRAFDRILELAAEMRMPEMTAGALIQRAELEAERGEAQRALTDYEAAFEALERTRIAQSTDEDRAGYLAQQRYAYEEFTHFLAEQHAVDPDGPYLDRAFEYAERGKARAFLDLLAEALADVEAGVDPVLRARSTQLMEAITEARQTLTAGGASGTRGESAAGVVALDSLEAAYDQIKRDIRASNPRYGELQYPSPASLSEVQASLLDAGTVLLQYAVGDSSTTLLAVTTDEAEMYRLPGRDVIQDRVELFRFALTNQNQADASVYATGAFALYQLIVEPAAGLVGEADRLIIIPDGALHYVPFEALVTSPAASDDFGELSYLVTSHQVTYAPSASVLLQLRESRSDSKAAEGLLALGDPVFTPESGLARLPYSGQEVDAIAGMFGSAPVQLFTGDSASEQGLKSALTNRSYKYLHLATHGLVNEDRPDFSGIALAPGSSDQDGFLQAAEIFNLRIDADMVVLSACETGLGRMVRGEGLVGLTRAFMYAGASSVVVSLWSVADESTAVLMERFYEGLTTSVARESALAQAKRSLISEGTFAHPFHWAPFVMVGEGGP